MPPKAGGRGLSKDEKKKRMLDYFYEKEIIRIQDGRFEKKLNFDILRGQRASSDLVDPKNGKVYVKKNRRISQGAIRQMQQAGLEFQVLTPEDMIGKVLSEDVLDDDGNVIIPVNADLDKVVRPKKPGFVEARWEKADVINSLTANANLMGAEIPFFVTEQTQRKYSFIKIYPIDL